MKAHVLIKGPEDYQSFFHTDREQNIWLDRKRNPIARESPLMGTEVESISPSLNYGRQKHQVKYSLHWSCTSKGGVTNNTTVNNSSPLRSLPYGPIYQSDDSVRHKEQFVRDLSSDPSITKHMIDEALSKVGRSGSDHQESGLEPSAPSTDPILDDIGIKHQGSGIKTTSPSHLW